MKKGCCRHAQVFHGSPDFSLYEVALIAISPFQIPFSLICAVLSGSYGSDSTYQKGDFSNRYYWLDLPLLKKT